MINLEKKVAQKFDKDNASFLILLKSQLEQILKARKQSLALDASDMIIKEWMRQQSYLEWWGLNILDHNLHFLISYKKVLHAILKFIQLLIHQNRKRRTMICCRDFSRQIQPKFHSNNLPICFEQEAQEDIERIQVEREHEQHENNNEDKPEPNQMSEQENKQINFNIKISDLTLKLSKDDYF
ncbi:unnamed protein product [Paramecium octaurelia]|uniref:Uncharacterized protein n=1 Tax=Paramecium octaurelia TaxID=43137 RepID=A0A8S1XL09_PAROT|nr:unnamed protein product [Paramecium octaurelia]